jgi:cysteine desulfurase/selenocysteine lyase
MSLEAAEKSWEAPKTSDYDVWRVRKDFPILKQRIYGNPLVFLDTAASAQKPQVVIDAVRRCYEQEYANIHRGVYYLSERATEAFEAARRKVQAFLNAREAREIVFLRGATEAINLVASSYGRTFLEAGDEILISHIEHHSNIVPWQILCQEKGLKLRVVPVNDSAELVFDEYARMLGERTKLVAITHMSNAVGTVTPIKEIIRLAHERGIPVLVDGCQAVPHMPVDVQDLDCDFYAFSGHKLFGPSGIGALYGKAEHLEAMPPYQGGGEMILSVTFEKTEYNVIPFKFEAGTPHIAGATGLGAAVDYVNAVGIERIAAHESALLAYATERLSELKGLRVIGTAKEKAAILSFVLEGVHPHDVGTVLDRDGIAVRTGHHCAQPVMDRFGVPATVRASLAMYNTAEDVDALVASIRKAQELFG